MSKIEVNTVEPQCGTTLTLGASGDTVTLGSGASQSGFGATGGISWQTSIKTADFTAVSGEGYFVNTSGGSNITVTLPASPSAGNVVAVKDYARTFGTNKVTLGRNGSNMDGNAIDTDLTINGQSIICVFMDSTKGWSFINEDDTSIMGAKFIAASGGNTTATCGNFKIHTFTSPGTFTVSCAGNSGGSNTVSYLVVGGGGGSAGDGTGGGGAGGFREGLGLNDSYTGSPLRAPTGVPVTATGFPITVGAGGAAVPQPTSPGNPGAASVFSSISSAGGGAGERACGTAGGSGGGAGRSSGDTGGAGNTPPVSPPQGNPGGDSPSPFQAGGGGGGATAAGGDAGPSGAGGDGGAGASSEITGSAVVRAGGGGGGSTDPQPAGDGGSGGGGQGGSGPSPSPTSAGSDGTVNTGGGGGGSSGNTGPQTVGRGGGSGIVIIRYKFQ